MSAVGPVRGTERMEDSRLSFFVADHDGAGWGRRSAVFVLCLGFWAACMYGLTPFVQRRFGDLPLFSSAHGLFWKHALLFSLPTALPCLLLARALAAVGCFKPVALRRDAGRALRFALGAGAAVAALTFAVVVPLYGAKLGFHLDLDSVMGNLFSNGYEEVQYRVLIMFAGLYLFRNRWAAIVLSGAVFGLTHAQYPVGLRLVVALSGAVFAWAYSETGSFLAPWAAHQFADVLLDCLLKL